MQLDPTNPTNYNGFVHPAYIAHLEPFVRHQNVTIFDAEIPNTDVISWAEEGFLYNFNTWGGTTLLEALVIKGEAFRFVDYLAGLNSTSSPYHWLYDYCLGSSEKSVSTVMSVIHDGEIMNFCTKLIGAICIQDFGFHDTDELTAFLMDNVHPRARRYLNKRLSTLFKNYLSTADAIREYEQSVPFNPTHHIECAQLWAKLGSEEKVRQHLEQAEKLAGLDGYAWRLISINYLRLLGDFEAADRARSNQLSNWVNLYSITQVAFDLVIYVGTDEAMSEGRSLMHRAEKHARSGSDYLELSDVWEHYFDDKDRADKFKELAITYDKK